SRWLTGWATKSCASFLGLNLPVARKLAQDFVAHPVSHRDLQRMNAFQDVQLRQREPLGSVDPDRMPNRNGIEPPATPRASRRGPKFHSPLAQGLAERVLYFRREGAFADARGVCLHDTKHVVNLRGRQTRTD